MTIQNKTFIIAEAGSNHNRIYEQALSLIDVAKDSGASAVKFQTYSSDTLYAKNTTNIAGTKDVNGLIKNIQIPREWQRDLKTYCDNIGIEFMSTPFDEAAVKELVDIGVKRIKIAGFEATDPRFVSMVSETGLPVIMSAGIGSSIKTLDKMMNICYKNGVKDITILHCNNAYPTPQREINLETITALKNVFPRTPVGLSDHTMSTMTPALAVCLGASTIEKHYTLSKRLSGPDHSFALEPDELKEMVDNIKTAEESMGVKKGFSKSENENKKAMRSVVARREIKSGETLTTDNITTKRPMLEDSIPASEYYRMLGRIAATDIGEDSLLKRGNVI